MLKALNYVLRLVLGGLFIFSGIVKLIDPKGTQIKLEEYFTAFSGLSKYYIGDFAGAFFEYLVPAGLFLSIGLSALEVVLGVAVLFWYKPKLTLWTTFGLLVFFGFLTGYSSSCDPNNIVGVSCVTDCGCFGDFLKLKQIESFYKDLILLVITAPLLLMAVKKNIPASHHKITQIMVLGSSIITVLFGVMNVINLPIVDFRPYKIGNNIATLRTDGKPAEIAYIMTKNGSEESFSEYPHEGDYTFVRVDEITPATEPTTKDFYLYDEKSGEDITERLLEKGIYLIIIKDINDLSESDVTNVNNLIKLLDKDATYGIITGNTFAKIREKLSLLENVQLFNIDETVIKAMVRNYPSLIQIKGGIIETKVEITATQVNSFK